MKNRIGFLVGLSIFLIATSVGAATRTWVSGVGDDFNPCTRTAPCKTFDYVISVTDPGGVISVLDEGDFGPVTITKSITIKGNPLAEINTVTSGTEAVIVDAALTDVVILRDLSINGLGIGLNGIRYQAGARLVVDHCSIHGFTQNDIEVSLTPSKNLMVRNSTLTGGAAGISLTNTTGTNTLAEVTNSLIAGNTFFGVHADGKGTISVANSLLANNGVAVQSELFAIVRLSNNEIFDNGTGIVGCGGGRVASARNNKEAGNGGGCTPPSRDSINVY